jgi:hypothetical protein
LPEAGLYHVAQDRFVDLFAVEAGAADGFGDGFGAEFDSGKPGEAPLEFTDGGAHGAQDYWCIHDLLPRAEMGAAIYEIR